MDWLGVFLDLAMQYYVAGRAAARDGLAPVYGNLLHHAVEMLLKAALLDVLTPDEMSRKPYRHDLTNLWNRYKAKEADVGLAGFDATIQALVPFEAIRYPDEIVRLGMRVFVAWAPGDVMPITGPKPQPPRYGVPINDVDALVIDIVKRLRVNPVYLVYKLAQPSGRDVLQHMNPYRAEWS